MNKQTIEPNESQEMDNQAKPLSNAEKTHQSQSTEASPDGEQRKAAGKALRDKCPKKAHAAWKAPSGRADPVELLIRSSEGRIPQLIPIRYGRMMQSPFAFYRGAAAIMAADLASTPTSGIRVQACGDCHLVNFGGFGTPEQRVIFDINDFDETLPAPWEWDLKRLTASFIVAGRNNKFSKAGTREAALRCVQSYRERMHEYADMSPLEMWYQRIDMDTLTGSIKRKKWKKLAQEEVAKAVSHTTAAEHDFPKLATIEHDSVRITDNPPLIFHQTDVSAAEYDQLFKAAFHRYRETLADDLRVLLDRYEVKDVALKVVGVGSVGTRCAIVLLMASDNAPLFLQVKEAHESVLEPYAGKSVYANHGHRVVAGQKLMQAASDMFLGWTEERGHFYVRQLSDIKIKPIIEIQDERSLAGYGGWCGWALARAQAKSGNAAEISGYIGKSSKFDDAIADFAVAYADQNERDHQAMLEAIRAGKIQVPQE
jgi:uncharacterized protein (DUF2252 family)